MLPRMRLFSVLQAIRLGLALQDPNRFPGTWRARICIGLCPETARTLSLSPSLEPAHSAQAYHLRLLDSQLARYPDEHGLRNSPLAPGDVGMPTQKISPSSSSDSGLTPCSSCSPAAPACLSDPASTVSFFLRGVFGFWGVASPSPFALRCHDPSVNVIPREQDTDRPSHLIPTLRLRSLTALLSFTAGLSASLAHFTLLAVEHDNDGFLRAALRERERAPPDRAALLDDLEEDAEL